MPLLLPNEKLVGDSRQASPRSRPLAPRTDRRKVASRRLPLDDAHPLGLERPQRNLPMDLLAPSKRSKVGILLRKMSKQSGRLNRSRTPKALPVGASLSLISAERDGHSAGAPSPPLDVALIHGRAPLRRGRRGRPRDLRTPLELECLQRDGLMENQRRASEAKWPSCSAR